MASTRLYFIQSGGPRGPVKIGHTSDVRRRIGNLQMGNPQTLRVILEAVVTEEDDARVVEKTLHNRFRDSHIRGEWFAYTAELGAVCRFMASEYSPPSPLPKDPT